MIAYHLNSNSDLDGKGFLPWIRGSKKFPLEKLYKKYYPIVYSLCLRMLRNHADAEELTHDTFILIDRKLDSFRGDSAITTWIHRVTLNQIFTFFRKRWRREESTT